MSTHQGDTDDDDDADGAGGGDGGGNTYGGGGSAAPEGGGTGVLLGVEGEDDVPDLPTSSSRLSVSPAPAPRRQSTGRGDPTLTISRINSEYFLADSDEEEAEEEASDEEEHTGGEDEAAAGDAFRPRFTRILPLVCSSTLVDCATALTRRRCDLPSSSCLMEAFS